MDFRAQRMRRLDLPERGERDSNSGLHLPPDASNRDVLLAILEELGSLNAGEASNFGQGMMIPYPGKVGTTLLRAPIPAGQVRFDFRQNIVTLPPGSPSSLPTSLSLPNGFSLRSVGFFVDDTASIALRPGIGEVYLEPHTWYSCPTDANEITLNASFPLVFWAIFSTRKIAPIISSPTSHQERWGAQTLTKVAAIGNADSFSDIKMTASDDTNQLDPATTGNAMIHCNGIGEKSVIVENQGVNDININIQMRHVSGKAWADIQDADASISVPAGNVLLAKIALHCHMIRIRGRVDAAEAAAATSDIEVQYRGFKL